MHNGVVGGFARIKRGILEVCVELQSDYRQDHTVSHFAIYITLLMSLFFQVLSDEAYNSIQSFHSDSAVSFALFLHHLPDMHKQHPPDVLLKAMQVRACTALRRFCVSSLSPLASSSSLSSP